MANPKCLTIDGDFTQITVHIHGTMQRIVVSGGVRNVQLINVSCCIDTFLRQFSQGKGFTTRNFQIGFTSDIDDRQ